MVLNRVAVTGASGMVGRHMLSYLESKGIFQCATSRTMPCKLPDNTVWSHWDLSQWQDEKFFDNIFPEVEAILHIGATVPTDFGMGHEQELLAANVQSCLNLGIWALKRNIPIVFLSSSVVYANPRKKSILETDEKTKGGMGGFYGYSKLLAEGIFQYLSSQGLRVCILRPSSIYGSGLPKKQMISRFLQIASENGQIEILPPVNATFNLIHACDVAEALWKALQAEAWSIYNIGGKDYTVCEIAQACIDTVGAGSIKINYDNMDLDIELVQFNLNCNKAKEDFLFSPAVDLREGLKRVRNKSFKEMEVMNK